MKGIKPERKPDPSGSGKMVEDFWGPSQKLLSDFKFLDSLKSYDKDNINPQIIKKIRDKLTLTIPYLSMHIIPLYVCVQLLLQGRIHS